MAVAEWFIVQTNPQREAFAADHLAAYEPYFPRFKAVTGRIKPLFPSYLFCVATNDWSPIKNTVGVRSILMNGDAPARIQHEVVSELKGRERGGLVELPTPPRFRAGERLVVTRGTLRYRVVIHTGSSARERENVLIDMLGSQIRLSIATDDLVSESEQAARNSLRNRRDTLKRERVRRFQ